MVRPGLIVETDGRQDHLTRHAFEEDRARDVRLTDVGYRACASRTGSWSTSRRGSRSISSPCTRRGRARTRSAALGAAAGPIGRLLRLDAVVR